MTPKKAIIIVLILFLAVAMVFAVLYINNKLAANQAIKRSVDSGYNSADSTNQAKLSPGQQKIKAIETKTIKQVEKIIEQGKTVSGGITAGAQKKVEEAVNREIMEKIKLKTPEELKKDEQRQAELEKIEQQVNQQIKSQTQNK